MITRAKPLTFPTSCEKVDYETGTITFNNGRTVTADLIIGADGIRVCAS